jgi:type II secretory pathway component GspD/PulD (secretin)
VTTQSIEYKSSGVIFEITPTIREGGALLDIHQQISNFVTTTNGVNNTPTLVKRELQTQVSAKDREVLLIGGLDDDHQTSNDSGVPFLFD